MVLTGTPPRRCSGPPVPPRAAPVQFLAAPPAALAPLDPTGRRAALPHRRLGPSPANQARHAVGHGPGGHGVAVLPVLLLWFCDVNLFHFM